MLQENFYPQQQQQQAQAPPFSGYAAMNHPPRPPFGPHNGQQVVHTSLRLCGGESLLKQNQNNHYPLAAPPPPPLPQHHPLRHQMGSENLPPSFVGPQLVGHARNYEHGPSPRLPPLYPQVAQQLHGQTQSQYPSRHLPQGQQPLPPLPPRLVQLRTAANGYVRVDGRQVGEWWHQAQVPRASQPLPLNGVGGGEGDSYHQHQQPLQAPSGDYLPQFVSTQRYHPEDPVGVQYYPHYRYQPQQHLQHQLYQVPEGAMAHAVYPYPSVYSTLPPPPPMSVPPRYHNPMPYGYDQYNLKHPTDRTGYPITGPTQAQAQPSGYQALTVPAGASSGTYGGGSGGGGNGGSGYTNDKPHHRYLSPSPPPAQVQKGSNLNPPGPLKRLNPFSPPFQPLDAGSNPVVRLEKWEGEVQHRDREQEQGLHPKFRDQQRQQQDQQQTTTVNLSSRTTTTTTTEATLSPPRRGRKNSASTGVGANVFGRDHFVWGSLTRTSSSINFTFNSDPRSRDWRHQQHEHSNRPQKHQRQHRVAQLDPRTAMGSFHEDDDMPVLSPPRRGLSPIGSGRMSPAREWTGRSEKKKSASVAADDVWGDAHPLDSCSFGNPWETSCDDDDSEEADTGSSGIAFPNHPHAGMLRFGGSPSQATAASDATVDEELLAAGGGRGGHRASEKDKLKMLSVRVHRRRHSSPTTSPSLLLHPAPGLEAYSTPGTRDGEGVRLELESNVGLGSAMPVDVDVGGSARSVHGERGVGGIPDQNGSGQVAMNQKQEQEHHQTQKQPQVLCVTSTSSSPLRNQEQFNESQGVVPMEVDEGLLRVPSYAEVVVGRAGVRLKDKNARVTG